MLLKSDRERPIAPTTGRRLRPGRRWRRSSSLVWGLLGLATLITFAWVGPAIYHQDPLAVRALDKLSGPTALHPLGADQFGRDILSRVMYGLRLSLTVAAASTLLAMVTGVAWGCAAGYLGGWRDEAAMRLADVLLSLPWIVLAIALAAAIGSGFWNVVLIVAVIRVAHFARLVRARVLLVRTTEYVLAATAIGQRESRILLRHVLPNSIAPAIVLASASAATAINAEAVMSFLGLGVNPPTPSLGSMLSDAQVYVLVSPTLAIWPGLTIAGTVLAFNLVSDGLVRKLDPRSVPAHG